jgi:hypothetical protein
MKRTIKLSAAYRIPISYGSLIKKEGDPYIDCIKKKQTKTSHLSKNKKVVDLPIYKSKEK